VERTLRCGGGALGSRTPSAATPPAPSAGGAASDGAAPLDDAASASTRGGGGGGDEPPGTRQLLFLPGRGTVVRVDTVRPGDRRPALITAAA
jgi:hypothetical protein